MTLSDMNQRFYIKRKVTSPKTSNHTIDFSTFITFLITIDAWIYVKLSIEKKTSKELCDSIKQSTLDISKLWGLFYKFKLPEVQINSNYPKCKLICTSGNLDL